MRKNPDRSKRDRLVQYETMNDLDLGARCAHSLEPAKIDWEGNTWPYLLKTEGEALLREAQP
jgi:hypothetical protein